MDAGRSCATPWGQSAAHSPVGAPPTRERFSGRCIVSVIAAAGSHRGDLGQQQVVHLPALPAPAFDEWAVYQPVAQTNSSGDWTSASAALRRSRIASARLTLRARRSRPLPSAVHRRAGSDRPPTSGRPTSGGVLLFGWREEPAATSPVPGEFNHRRALVGRRRIVTVLLPSRSSRRTQRPGEVRTEIAAAGSSRRCSAPETLSEEFGASLSNQPTIAR